MAPTEQLWIIEPRDPLICRDGRPFNPTPGARARTLDFPFPSTTTGAVRTQAGLKVDGTFDTQRIAEVRQLAVRGPLLVQLAAGEPQIVHCLVPAPADALIFEPDQSGNTQQPFLRWLHPQELPPGALTDLHMHPYDGTQPAEQPLDLVGLSQPDPRKPARNVPRFWYWKQFEQWLAQPHDQAIALDTLGLGALPRASRMHVKIDPETLTSSDGDLFQTEGLEFTQRRERQSLADAGRLALVVATAADAQLQPRPGVAHMGGEKRVVVWRKADTALPGCPEQLVAKVQQTKMCRVILLTPAYFAQGFRPTWLLQERVRVQPTLRAIAVQRPQVVSGWDFEHGRAKPTRRLAPAGTVLFLQLDGAATAIEEWIAQTWMQCVSDDSETGDAEQFRRDGFGLAVVGTWPETKEQQT